jgi:lipopolysaccharide export LptBFGC system permease protein LptF
LIGRLSTRGRWLLGVLAIASCVAYWLLMDAGRVAVIHERLLPTAGAWLPNATFIAAVILLSRRTPNDERRTAAVTR